MPSNPDNRVVPLPSRHSLEQTVERLLEALLASGVNLFALSVHSGEAEGAGMQCGPPSCAWHPPRPGVLVPNRSRRWELQLSEDFHPSAQR